MSTAIYLVGMLVVFVLGGELGFFLGFFLWAHKPAPKVEEKNPAQDTDEEMERARKEREELINSQKAFQRMMGYNADIAYGVDAMDDFPAGGS